MPTPPTPKIIVCTNSAWTLYNYRGALIRTLRDAGFEVIAAAPYDRHAERFAELGVRFEGIRMSPAGMNPVSELRTILDMLRLYRRERPDLVHHFSQKPILYGTFAARLAGVARTVNTVTGIGSTFGGKASAALRLVRPVLMTMMRFGLRAGARVTFQNDYDLGFYVEHGLVSPDRSRLIRGSGVDIDRFRPAPQAGAGPNARPMRFLMFSRMIRSKGVEEYCRAAEQVMADPALAGRADFVMIGGARVGNDTGVDDEWICNPETISGDWLAREAGKGHLTWMPHQEDILPHIHAADVIVLPSYFPEGLPRSLLEAMACGKAIVTCDMPGCRDTVDDGVNGYLVEPRSVDSLADAMRRMIEAPARVVAMGAESRRMVIERFSDDTVVGSTLEEYRFAGIPVALPA